MKFEIMKVFSWLPLLLLFCAGCASFYNLVTKQDAMWGNFAFIYFTLLTLSLKSIDMEDKQNEVTEG